MDGLLKRHFWVVNLLVIAVCAAFAGRALAHWVTGTYLVSEAARTTVRRSAPNKQAPVHTKEPDEINRRNVFCSGCAPIVPVATVPTGAELDKEQKTSLQLELVSTMICPDDDAWSMAVIRDMSTKEKDPAMYAKESSLPSGAKIARVTSHRVYLRNNGQLEYLDMEGAVAPVAVATNDVAPVAGDPGAGDVDKGVTCNGNACTVERQLVEKMLSNTTMLATAARFVPSIKDGKPNGFKLYAIRPNSIFGKIGLLNGDTIKAINGNDMTTPDAALALYSKLRYASHLSVQIERRGETVTLDYSIR